MELYLIALFILMLLAVSDLVVGVSNDAVNFLNSSIGSKVAPKHWIFIISSLGILAGVTFSSGMMEVARKGIFNPSFFTMPELMTIFLAVMLTDIVLLDMYNTFGLPTSTTVSIIFELLGGSVAISVIKMAKTSGMYFGDYINTAKVLAIISGILLSVVIAFLVGSLVQYVTRMLFTFNYHKRLKRYGGLWGGIALTSIIYFIIIKGAKGASFIAKADYEWIMSHSVTVLAVCFAFFFILFQLLTWFTSVNILKIIILCGTFAIAMSFAANDLVNFIGVPLAGLNAYQTASHAANPFTLNMTALQQQIHTKTGILLIAGVIMVITLWFSKKAQTVTKTELSLARQDEGVERYGSSALARVVVRMFSSVSKSFNSMMPVPWQKWLDTRFDLKHYRPVTCIDGDLPCWDLLRASVNLVVASGLISMATSLKLPLSTTYVTFMVAMGTSLADRSWGSDSAVFRVTGVLTVIGGWFFTAIMAFTVSSIIALVLYYGKVVALIAVVLITVSLIIRNHRIHNLRNNAEEKIEVFNLKKITDANFAVNASFEHSGHFLQDVNEIINQSFTGLFEENRQLLKGLVKETQKIQTWADIIIANVFKTMRLLNRDDVGKTQKYAQTSITLQEIAESQRDITLRAYTHIDNNHKGLLKIQIEELMQIRDHLNELLTVTSNTLLKKHMVDLDFAEKKCELIKKLANDFDKNQIQRIQSEKSKTRLSILFYGLSMNAIKVAEQTLILQEIFNESFKRKEFLKN
jgi:hypothetical protein